MVHIPQSNWGQNSPSPPSQGRRSKILLRVKLSSDIDVPIILHFRLTRLACHRWCVHPIIELTRDLRFTAGRCASAACTKPYTVKSGDTCDDIAVAQGVSSYQVSFLNGGGNACDSLFIGQSLCLATTAYNCQPVYTIVSGDE